MHSVTSCIISSSPYVYFDLSFTGYVDTHLMPEDEWMSWCESYFICTSFNLRTGGGGRQFDHTTWFLRIAEKRRRCAPFLAYLFIHQFCTLPQNFSTRLSQVGSLGQVKWPYLRNIHDCAVTTVLMVSLWNFQLINAPVPTKRISRNFDLGDLRSGQFWELTIIRQLDNVQMPLSESIRGNVLFSPYCLY